MVGLAGNARALQQICRRMRSRSSPPTLRLGYISDGPQSTVQVAECGCEAFAHFARAGKPRRI
jgi:hypothetical protein